MKDDKTFTGFCLGLGLAIVMVVLVALVGCGKKKDQPPAKPATQTACSGTQCRVPVVVPAK